MRRPFVRYVVVRFHSKPDCIYPDLLIKILFNRKGPRPEAQRPGNENHRIGSRPTAFRPHSATSPHPWAESLVLRPLSGDIGSRPAGASLLAWLAVARTNVSEYSTFTSFPGALPTRL